MVIPHFVIRVLKKVTIRLITHLLYHVSGNSKSAFADKTRRRHFFRNLFDIESDRFANNYVNSRTRWSQISFHRVLQRLDNVRQLNRLIQAQHGHAPFLVAAKRRFLLFFKRILDD